VERVLAGVAKLYAAREKQTSEPHTLDHGDWSVPFDCPECFLKEGDRVTVRGTAVVVTRCVGHNGEDPVEFLLKLAELYDRRSRLKVVS